MLEHKIETGSLPSISVQIPTRNSSRFIRSCLESVISQKYPKVELVIIDTDSSDNTVEVAKSYGANVISSHSSLLASRIEGIRYTSSDAILLLDSDQELISNSLFEISKELAKHDILFLEELSSDRIRPTKLQKLYEFDRIVSYRTRDNTDPESGVVLPRVFRTEVLKKAIDNIPVELSLKIQYPDHAIIYFEACKFSDNTSHVRSALQHHENTSFLSLIKKHLKYGIDAANVFQYANYKSLILLKAKPRKLPISSDLFKYWVYSQLLLVLKAIPYEIGFFTESRRIRRRNE